MSFSPVAASEHIYDKYRRYLKTIFAIDDPVYNRQFQEQLENRRTLVAGPYLDVSDSFVKGKSIEELIEEGVIAESFRKIHMPLTRPLYKHQEIALRKAEAGENLIVSTGTGSGKTECFLIPILNELMKEQESGTLSQGVRALLVYPMNALANDQIERLRELLADCPQITFGSYTGQTKNKFDEALADYKELNGGSVPLPNELISRQQIKENIPHILVTNYAMLEYLMVRPGDNVFFSEEHSEKWKYIILDEAHVYNGSSGIEVGMLLRRLKAMLQNDKIQYILTSATLGSEDSDAEVAAFGSNLCNSTFSKDNIIRATRYKPRPSKELKRLPTAFYKKLADAINSGIEDDSLTEYIDDEYRAGQGSDIHEVLYDLILHDENYVDLRQALDQPLSVREIIGTMNWREEDLVNFVTVASKAVRNGDRLFDARYHTFLRATDSVFVTLKPEKRLFLTRQQSHIEDGERRHVFEIATCSVCHSMYLLGKVNDAGCLVQSASQNEEGPRTAYLVRDEISDKDEDHLLEDEKLQTQAYEVCSVCGHVHNPGKNSCGHGAEYMTKVYKVWTDEEKGTLTKCPACENVSPFGILRQFFTGQEAVTSVLGTALFEELPSYSVTIRHEKSSDDGFDFEDEGIIEEKKPEAKQFIAFSDNRQAAAFFASYFDQSYRNILYKRLIVEELKGHPDSWEGESVSNFVQTLAGLFEKYKLLDLENTQSEREAWKAILQEMVDNNSGTSLLKTGLIAFGVPTGLLPGHSKYHLSQEDVMNMINVLALGMMSDAAIHYDYSLNKTDKEYFTYGGVECSYTLSDSDAKKYRRSFTPKITGRTNKRADYIQRVFEKLGNPTDNETIIKFMENLWNLIVKKGIMKSVEGVYRLDTAHLRVTRPGKWYLCSRCKRITPFNLHGVCPTYQCPGELREIDIREYNQDNHYYSLYNTLDIRSLRVVEHTAQLSKEIAYDYQKKFKQKEIDVLSCSTTFEMGVDVGTLETVFMRNMPPSPANYAQRAGRAGRSKLASAFALTFCNKRSHDFSYFNRPVRMIRGRIDPPKFEMENDKIAIRHVFASALAFFWRQNPDYFSNAGVMVEKKEDGLIGFDAFKQYLESHPEDLKRFIKRFLPAELSAKYGVDNFGWLEMLLKESESEPGVLTRAFEEYNYEVKVLKDAYEKAVEEKKFTDRFLRQIRTYQQEDILSFLSRKNVMPKYGFPVDTVELHLSGRSEKAKAGLQLSRDLSIAISEYAPGSQVVANGDLITSRYIRMVPGMTWKQYLYNTCKCGTLNIEPYADQEDTQERMKECRQCGEKLDQRHAGVFLVPAFGFEADGNIRKPGLKKPERTFSSETSYVGYMDSQKPTRYSLNGCIFEIAMGHNDEMAVLNRSNFFVCMSCGYTDLDKGYFLNVKKKVHERSSGRKCVCENLIRRSIGYRFETDVFQLRFINPEIKEMDVALSVLYGIMRGICSCLNIEQDDISGCVQYFRNEDTGNGCYALIYYDRTPGGAGYVKRLADPTVLSAVFKETLDLMNQCNCGGAEKDSSCYGCLRTYYNQRHHDLLKRSYVIRFIETLLGMDLRPIRSNGAGNTFDVPVIRPITEIEDQGAEEMLLTVVQDGMNLDTQSWSDIWEYMLDEDPEQEEEAFYRALLGSMEELENKEKPYKGSCQLKDKKKVSTEVINCNMLWKKKKILLFTAENAEDYRKARNSDWTCIFTMEGERAAQELIHKLKED